MSKEQKHSKSFHKQILLEDIMGSDDEIKALIDNKENIDPNIFIYCLNFEDYYKFRLNAGLSGEKLLLGDNSDHHNEILDSI